MSASVSTPGFSGRTAENADGARSPATALAGTSGEVGARGPSAAGVGDGTDDRRPLPRVAGGAANHRAGLAGGRAARGNVGASAGSGDLVAGQPGNLLGDAPDERGRRVASVAVGCGGPAGRQIVATTAIVAWRKAVDDGASAVAHADGVAATTPVRADRPGQTPRAAARPNSARAVGPCGSLGERHAAGWGQAAHPVLRHDLSAPAAWRGASGRSCGERPRPTRPPRGSKHATLHHRRGSADPKAPR